MEKVNRTVIPIKYLEEEFFCSRRRNKDEAVVASHSCAEETLFTKTGSSLRGTKQSPKPATRSPPSRACYGRSLAIAQENNIQLFLCRIKIIQLILLIFPTFIVQV
jgi:hypothetical protein